MSHLENASLQLKGTVGHVHHLQPVPVTNLLGVKLFEERQYLEVVFYLSPQLPGGIPLFLFNWKALIGQPKPRHLREFRSMYHNDTQPQNFIQNTCLYSLTITLFVGPMQPQNYKSQRIISVS